MARAIGNVGTWDSFAMRKNDGGYECFSFTRLFYSRSAFKMMLENRGQHMAESVHRIGAIGLGGIGRTTLSSMAAHSSYELICAWDPDESACVALRQTCSEMEIAASANAVIDDPRTTAIYVASPPLTHAAYIRSVAEKGKCILCEKPLGVNVSESEALVTLVADRDVPNVINFNHSNATASCYLESELASGAMGDIAGIDIFIHLTQWPREFQAHATWLKSREQGGFTREMLSHWIYLTQRLFGEGHIISRQVHFPNNPRQSEVRLLAELEFGGIPAVINAAIGGAGPVGTDYTVWGTKKSLRMQSGGRISSSQGDVWQQELANIANFTQIDISRNIAAAAQAFRREHVKVPTLADGLAVQKIVEALIA
jgi:1,5-anhydro-D-fructose reductase (1,5-anhydro-D-mannitol-forming)